MNDLNPSKSWAARPHHVEGVPPIVYFFFLLFCLIVGIYIFYQIRKEKNKNPLNRRLLEIEAIIKARKKPPHS